MNAPTIVLENEVVRLQNQIANLKAEYRDMVTQYDGEARLYRTTIDNLRDEVHHMTVLADGRDRALTLAINQRDQAMALLRQIDKMLIDFINAPRGAGPC